MTNVSRTKCCLFLNKTLWTIDANERRATHNHEPNEQPGVHRVNRQRAFIKENIPTASSIPVVTGNRAEEHCLSADESGNVKPAVQ